VTSSVIRDETTHSNIGQVSDIPYRHILCEKVFEPKKAKTLLGWLETDAKWRYEDHSFYQQYACRNVTDCTGRNGEPLLNDSNINSLMENVERVFKVAIRRDQYHVAVHKLLPGQGIGVHTDRPDEGSETHRFVVHLNSRFHDSFGGHLLMFLDREGRQIANIIRPLHNSGVAFALSSSSYHAVNNVKAGIRYSIVFSFWDVEALHQGEGVPTSTVIAQRRKKGWPLDRKYRQVVQLLDRLGADTILHGRGTLLDHLKDTCDLLEVKTAPRVACLAGLCHSVYGTSSFSTALLSFGQRSILRKALGYAAERVVYLYCASTFGLDGDGSIFSRISGRPLKVSESERRALHLIIAANRLAQGD
jgi:hypothetical protein